MDGIFLSFNSELFFFLLLLSPRESYKTTFNSVFFFKFFFTSTCFFCARRVEAQVECLCRLHLTLPRSLAPSLCTHSYCEIVKWFFISLQFWCLKHFGNDQKLLRLDVTHFSHKTWINRILQSVNQLLKRSICLQSQRKTCMR